MRLKPFWERLGRRKRKIKAVAMDMSPAYRKAVATHLPKAMIVFDHFHVIKLFNDKLSDLRRSLYHQAEDEQKKVLKGVAVAAAEGPREPRPRAGREEPPGGGLEAEQAPGDGLLPQGGPAAVLGPARQDGSPTRSCTDWIRRAEASGIRMLQQMAKTLEAHRAGLLAYYDYPISTGPLEGTNNKIKTMKRQAYGFRDHGVLQAEDPGHPRDEVCSGWIIVSS